MRLVVWIAVVCVFYGVVLGEAAWTAARSPGGEAAGWHDWLLLLFPLFLLPYFFSLARELRRADELILDASSGSVSNRRQSLAAFSDIREIQLRTVHGTCEEFRVTAVLSDGSSIRLIETDASAEIVDLAEEIADLVGVEVARTA